MYNKNDGSSTFGCYVSHRVPQSLRINSKLTKCLLCLRLLNVLLGFWGLILTEDVNPEFTLLTLQGYLFWFTDLRERHKFAVFPI